MISYRRGKVSRIREEDGSVQWINAEIDGEEAKAVNYPDLTGRVKAGDEIVVNTTAVDLSLGTGGEHFVITNLSEEKRKLDSKGHIMKLRYTPSQTQVMAAEAQESRYHEKIKEFESLHGMPVITATLHSMAAPIAAYIKKKRPDLNICYIMTDGGALMLPFSKNVKTLKEKGIIKASVTAGNAVGGDYETVNIYTALIAAKEAAECDIAVVSMGPGIAGTGTEFGFSGTEQGYISDGVISLGGKSIMVPRISFADRRERHKGLSHHSRTIFTKLSARKADIVFPVLSEEENAFLKSQIEESEIGKFHNLIYRECTDMKDVLEHYGLRIKTMGRGYDEDSAFFDTLGAAAEYALECCRQEG